MQVHPTRDFSRKNFNSPYGKAEAWLILATRPDACIYFGFDRQVSREEFSAAVEAIENDKEAMTAFVNKVPVQTGDVFFVGAGVIHAIGPGCMLLEAQEPTDFTIQPEYRCGDYALSDQEMYYMNPSIIVGSAACFLPEKAGSWSYPYSLPYANREMLGKDYFTEERMKECEDGEETAFNMINSMMGTMYLSGHIECADSKNVGLIKEAIDAYINPED
jgi:hypothetical protein